MKTIHLGNPKGGLLVDGGTTRLPVLIEDTDGPREEIFVSVRALTPTVREGETARCEVKVEEAGGRALDTGIRVQFRASNAGIEDKDVWLTFGRAASQMRQVDVETIAMQSNDSRTFDCRVGPADYLGSYELEITKGAAEVRIENINVGDQPGDTPIWAFDQRTGERTLRFVARLNGELPDALTGTGKDPLVVSWATSAGDDATAIAGEDYTVSSGMHTFHSGASREFRIRIPIRCDTADEDEEHFYVTATGARTNGDAVGGESTVRITIVPEADRCGGTKRVVSIADASAIEGQRMEFTVSVPTALEHDLLIDYATEQVSNSARAGEDFEAATGTVTIHRIHNTTATIRIQTLRDDIRDERETFRVRLSNARTEEGPRRIADDVAVGTIIEKKPIGGEFRAAPAYHSGDPFQVELHLTAQLDIQEDELPPKITVQETGSDESAGTASEAEVLRERVYRFSITPNSGVTGNLTIGLDHTDLTGLNGRRMGEVEPVVVHGRSVVSIEDAEVNESDGALDFIVKLDGAARSRTTVDWATEDVTASSGRDYEASSGTFTFEAGETRKRGKIIIFRTARAEDDETFSIVLSNALPSNRIVIDPDRGTGTMTIKDDSLAARGTRLSAA